MKRLETFYHVFWTRSTSAPPIYIIVNTTRFEEMREIEPDHDCFDVRYVRFVQSDHFQTNYLKNNHKRHIMFKFSRLQY